MRRGETEKKRRRGASAQRALAACVLCVVLAAAAGAATMADPDESSRATQWLDQLVTPLKNVSLSQFQKRVHRTFTADQTGEMASLRLVLPASALLVLALCWSVDANPTERSSPLGVVTNYITPMANFSRDKLAGRWYMAEVLQFELPKNVTSRLCLLLDFHYDDNGTFVAEPIGLTDGVRTSPYYAFPVSENVGWDAIFSGVSGGPHESHSHLVVHVDDHFLAVATCQNDSVKSCAAYTMVRHVADGDRRSELEDLRRRLASAGVDNKAGFVKVIEPCRSLANATLDLSVQNGSSTPHTE